MFQGGGRENNTHTFRQVDMFKWHKVIPRHIEVLVIGLHMVGNAYGSWSWSFSNLLSVTREPVSFIYSHHTFPSFFLSFVTHFFFYSFLTPLELYITLVLPWQPPMLRHCLSQAKQVIKDVTRWYWKFWISYGERYSKSSRGPFGGLPKFSLLDGTFFL
jgi:hypothetical protein